MQTISIVMATYNGAKYIAEQLDSIILQSVKPDEMIIVDDGSTDETISILERYSYNYSWIKVFKNNKNLGVVKTFERAISLTKCDLIFFADQDDVWFKNKIEGLISNLGDNWLVYSDSIVTDEFLNEIHASSLQHFESGRRFSEPFDYLLGNNVTGCTMLINRKILEHALPFPDLQIMYHDHYLAIVAVMYNKLSKYSHPLMYYRQHSFNQSSAFREIGYANILKNSKAMAEDLRKLTFLFVMSENRYKLDLSIATEFYLAMGHESYPTLTLIYQLKSKLSPRMFFWFIRMACLGKWLAYLNYNLAPIKDKIKSFLGRKHSCK